MIIYHELSSIEADLGISVKTLYGLSNSLSKHYRPVDLPKRSGGTRRLYVPDEALKRVQRAIAENLLILEPVSRYATAYRVGTSIISNARPHTGKDRILKLDINKFFDNILYSTVKDKAFPKERYAENIRILLALLCYYKDVLPQGAPTSPAISNIIMYEFDNAVGDYCRAKHIKYTRYCDDMTFSGKLDNIPELINFVESELKKHGFFLNRKKTKSVSSSSRQTVTGLVVNEKVNISSEYKRNIRKEMYFLHKFGIKSHLEKIGSTQSQDAFLQALLGRINFVLQICPDDDQFKEYRASVLKYLKNDPI